MWSAGADVLKLRNTQSHSKKVRTKLVSGYRAECCISPPIEDGEGYDADPTFFLFPLLRWESQFDEVFLRELPVNVFVLLALRILVSLVSSSSSSEIFSTRVL